jgi:hypothetical protein
MVTDRDPLFLACFNAAHEGYKDEPDYALTNPQGTLLLRTNESIVAQFNGNFMFLRYPEQMWLINPEKVQSWNIYFTTERIIGIKSVFFPGSFEFFDHIETHGKFAGLHPTEEMTINQFFKLLGQNDKKLNQFSLIFQLAYTRISMISCVKLMSPDVAGIEFWYEDGPNASQTQIHIYPAGMASRQIYDLGVKLQGASLKEKEFCLQKKHQLDPAWEPENYNTFLAGIQRLVRAPDFLAMGSGTLDNDSYDPITFQPHPILWAQDVFSRSMKGSEPIRIVNLKY